MPVRFHGEISLPRQRRTRVEKIQRAYSERSIQKAIRRVSRRLHRDEHVEVTIFGGTRDHHRAAETAEQGSWKERIVQLRDAVGLHAIGSSAKRGAESIPSRTRRIKEPGVRKRVSARSIKIHRASQAAGLGEGSPLIRKKVHISEQVLPLEAGRSAGIEILAARGDGR